MRKSRNFNKNNVRVEPASTLVYNLDVSGSFSIPDVTTYQQFDDETHNVIHLVHRVSKIMFPATVTSFTYNKTTYYPNRQGAGAVKIPKGSPLGQGQLRSEPYFGSAETLPEDYGKLSVTGSGTITIIVAARMPSNLDEIEKKS